ncbi:MAG: hypothetical protein R3A10_03580 [Caldilineaceae bacterium]
MVDGVAGLRLDNPGGQKGGNDEQERVSSENMRKRDMMDTLQTGEGCPVCHAAGATAGNRRCM